MLPTNRPFRSIALFMAMLLFANIAFAENTWYVDDDAPNDPAPGDTTGSDPAEDGSAAHPFDAIQEAIDASADGDTVIVLAGVYSGEGNRNIDFGGRAITVRSEGGSDTCVIDLEYEGSGFLFTSGETPDAVLDGFMIRRAGEGWYFAGGIYCSGSEPVVFDCLITDCDDGGVVCLHGSDPILIGCVITDNRSAGVRCYYGCAPILIDCLIARNSNRGGIVQEEGEILMLSGCEISDNFNEERSGGGISCYGGSLILSDCILLRNRTNYIFGGGGIYCQGDSLTIHDSLIRENVAEGPGGGIHSQADLTALSDCDIGHNVAYNDGGGVFCEHSSTIEDCSIYDNVATYGGGGIWCRQTMIANCRILGNRTSLGSGGGVYTGTSGTSGGLVNCVLAGNSTGLNGEGGGVYCEGDTSLTHCTIVANTAGGFGGGGIYGDWYGVDTEVCNCILWNNVPDEIGPADAMSVTYSDVQGGRPEGEGNIDVDPLIFFADDPYLSPESPCVDAGTNFPPNGSVNYDLDGRDRQEDGDGDGNRVVDMGAFELNPDDPAMSCSPHALCFVTYPGQVEVAEQLLTIRGSGGFAQPDHNLAWSIHEDCQWLTVEPAEGVSVQGAPCEVVVRVDATGIPEGTYHCLLELSGSWYADDPRGIWVTLDVATGYPAIQDLIDAAESGDVVIVPDGVYTGPENRNLDFHGKALTLRSESGPENCIIDCQRRGRGFLFQSGELADSVVDGFTITNGEAGMAAGIACWDGSPTIRNCSIVDNCSSLFACGIGIERYCNPTLENCEIARNTSGGVSVRGGRPSIIDCTIRDNEGAGIIMYSSSARVTNCVISNNTAYYGGGVRCYDWCGGAFNGCTIENNEARHGGGVYCEYYDFTVFRDCIIRDNIATSSGGGIYSESSSPKFDTCTIMDNQAPHGGGIYCYGHAPRILNCIIDHNFAIADHGNGGGVYLNESDAILAQCLVVHNSAVNVGGGICVRNVEELAITGCTIADNTADDGGGVCFWSTPDITVANCSLWNNTAANVGSSMYIVAQNDPATVNVRYCNVDGGESGIFVGDDSSLVWGDGNIDADPFFADPVAGDYHLQAGSPCIDAGRAADVVRDYYDSDNDGNTTERILIDLDGMCRFFDDPETPDSGDGNPPLVDIGPYEFGAPPFIPCIGDLSNDGEVDLRDLGILLSNYGETEGASPREGDLDDDDDVDIADLATMLGVFGPCP